jgi:hypothetical protein
VTLVTGVNQTTAPFLTGATLNTNVGNAITGVTTMSTPAQFVNGLTPQSGNFLTGTTTTTTPVLNGATLNTNVGNAITGVTTTSTGGQFAT